MTDTGSWQVEYLEEAVKDLERLDGSLRIRVLKAISKVSQNPLPYTEGGYGKPLGNKNIADLTGLFKIKIKNPGIRVVYKLVREKGLMKIVVVAARSDNFVYKEAQKRS